MTRIKAFGIKGGDFNHELSGVTLVCGKNFTGKTARLEAVRLALMGYLPELGKTGVATMGLARNGGLTVEADMEDGRHVSRSWKQGKSGVKATVDGSIPETPAVLMDPSTYFSLGDKDRIRYVFGLINVEEKVNADVVISELKNIRLEENTEATEKALRELVDWVDESDRARQDLGTPVQDWLEEIVAGIREKLKTGRQTLDRLSKTVQGLTQVQASEDPAVDVSEDLEQARKRVGDLRSELAVINERIRKAASVRGEIQRLHALKVKLECESADIPALEKELVELISFGYSVPDCGSIESGLNESRKRQAQFESEYKMQARRADGFRKEIAEVNALECCPSCKCKGKGWRQNLIGNREELRAEAVGLMNELAKRQEEAAAEVAAGSEALAKARDLEQKERDRQSRVSRLEMLLRVARQNSDELGRVNEALKIQPIEEDYSASRSDLETAIAAAQEEVNRLDGMQRKADAEKSEAARRAQVILDHGEQAIYVSLMAEAVKAMEKLQVKLVEDAFGVIMAKANRLVEGIMLSPLEYKDGEIGRWNGGTWVPHKTFSGTEKALGYAAISLALAADAPCKIVMIDELGRLDLWNLEKLLGRAKELVEAGVIDQFIGVGTHDMALCGSQGDFQIINL